MNLQLTSDFLTEPIKAFRQLKDYKLAPWVTLILILARLAVIPQSLPLNTSVAYAVIQTSISSVVLVFIVAAYSYGIAKLFNGKANFLQTYQAIGIAFLPMILFGPIGLLQVIWPLSTLVGDLSYLVNFVLSLWVIYLLVLGIRETHQISTGGALASLLAGPVLMILLLFGLAFVFASYLSALL